MDRRTLLKTVAATGLLATTSPLSLAKAATDRRLILIQLRGGLDGLAAFPALGDPDYAKARGRLALDAADTLQLDGFFGCHPSLPVVHRLFEKGEALIQHATCTPYRQRSHFDGQDVLEAGLSGTGGLRDGWLGRALQALPGGPTAIAVGRSVPLVLTGSDRASNWSPGRLPDAQTEMLERAALLYAEDPIFATALQKARMASDMAGAETMMAPGFGPAAQARQLADAISGFLTGDARIAVADLNGWDSHANQGTTDGQLAVRLEGLNTLLAGLAEGLASVWDRTAILVVTEFGRTVAPNGTGGSDHGVGGAAMLLGGAVRGGRVVTDWPGLSKSALYQGRDLRPTSDLRGLMKAVAHDHLGIADAVLERDIFPESHGAKRVSDMIRA